MNQFDELFVISDLHMGGRTGFQIFDQGPELAGFIRYLADRSDGVRLGLVINGDMVDFLAEPEAVYFDAFQASRKLNRIMDDPAFKMVWDALADFIRCPGRTLIVTLGNHDVELGLPQCRALLSSRLAGDDDAARGRLNLAFRGTGYTCQVGSRSVLCLHGNEVDPFNWVDQNALRKTIQALNRGQMPRDWPVNAGTQLVIDVMNDIKERFRWVDLLKPEMEAALPILAAIAPGQLKQLGRLHALVKPLAETKFRMEADFLEEHGKRIAPQDGKRERVLQENATQQFFLEAYGIRDGKMGQDDGSEEDRLLISSRRSVLKHGSVNESSFEDSRDSDLLGLSDWVEDRWSDLSNYLERCKKQALRKALASTVASNKSFDTCEADATYKGVSALVGPEIDFVVTGHTHLGKHLPRLIETGNGGRKGKGAYLNSGTWVCLMKLTEDWLASDAAFEKLWDVLAEGSIEGLREANLIHRPNSVVAITRNIETGDTDARLVKWDADNKELVKP